MAVTSFSFLAFLLVGGVIYYMVPRKLQWGWLLMMSMAFYQLAAVRYTIVFLLAQTGLAYVSTNLMDSAQMKSSRRGRQIAAWVTAIAIILNVALWFLLKGSAFWISGSALLHSMVPSIPAAHAFPAAAALGMGYYTAQVIGYILDCYWENVQPQRNFLKLLLFVSFFPQMTVGPISRYAQMGCLYEGHSFSYRNLCFGSQRILWGFYKKLVLSDRIRIIVDGIWLDTDRFGGFWPWIAVFCYPWQIYTDFSGCMDIILGASEAFGIHLQENFKNPFFSRTCQEFWQRWHITLGTWARDYVYYPVLKSRPLIALGKWSKKHFKKRTAKLIPWALGMGILWFVMGFWHGSAQHILGVGLWFWAILVISEVTSPLCARAKAALKVDTGCFSWHLFQSARTYFLYALGVVFFSASGLREAISRCGILLASIRNLNPWIFFNGNILWLGVSWRDINILVAGAAVLLSVACLREKYGHARTWVAGQILPFRWALWLGLFVTVMVYGLYGPGYDVSDFIYGGF